MLTWTCVVWLWCSLPSLNSVRCLQNEESFAMTASHHVWCRQSTINKGYYGQGLEQWWQLSVRSYCVAWFAGCSLWRGQAGHACFQW